MEHIMIERYHVLTTLSVLEYLIHHQGTAYTAQGISNVVSCSLAQAQQALDTLADARLVDRLAPTPGVVTYLVPT
jgi:Fe2+ or Zn2+ uptake regulation protein